MCIISHVLLYHLRSSMMQLLYNSQTPFIYAILPSVLIPSWSNQPNSLPSSSSPLDRLVIQCQGLLDMTAARWGIPKGGGVSRMPICQVPFYPTLPQRFVSESPLQSPGKNNTTCRCFTETQLKGRKLPAFVPPHPSRNAASCAKSSPNPNISPLINGKSKLIAAPRRSPQSVGGLYSIIGGELEEEGGEGESSSLPEYCSESEGMVIEDSVRGLSEDMAGFAMPRYRQTREYS